MVPESEMMVGYLVKRVQYALRRHSDAALHATGLSTAQFAVLRALADHPEASASELARLCFVTRQSLQDVLGGLRGRGLVADGPARGRVRPLRLTPAGRRTLAAASDVMSDVEVQLTEGLSAVAKERLVRNLLVCADNLEP